MPELIVDSNGWIVEGISDPIDKDQLASLYFSNQLMGKQIHPVGVDLPLTHQQLTQIVGDIAPPPPLGFVQPPTGNYYVPPTEDPLRFVMPVNPSMWAVAAGYLGLFSVLCLPAPIAIYAGIKGLKEIKNDPNKNGDGRAWFGIIMGVLGTIMLLVSILVAIGQSAATPK